MAEKKKKPVHKCHLCADSGNVPRSYLEPYIGAITGKQKVKCPRCQPTSQYQSHNQLVIIE